MQRSVDISGFQHLNDFGRPRQMKFLNPNKMQLQWSETVELDCYVTPAPSANHTASTKCKCMQPIILSELPGPDFGLDSDMIRLA